ncbi:hypothetical protein Hypma_014640 [Hypsizygus marmoreus]|uniref:Uncharacterized protein n=1 Tax=Hypsizygus marmoreus TaxID=39966 RepID=A0A369JDQ0_HYPMA|nr:hypothetical protein Hypma_014640 [Hypsizygus marmoreus]
MFLRESSLSSFAGFLHAATTSLRHSRSWGAGIFLFATLENCAGGLRLDVEDPSTTSSSFIRSVHFISNLGAVQFPQLEVKQFNLQKSTLTCALIVDITAGGPAEYTNPLFKFRTNASRMSPSPPASPPGVSIRRKSFTHLLARLDVPCRIPPKRSRLMRFLMQRRIQLYSQQ